MLSYILNMTRLNTILLDNKIVPLNKRYNYKKNKHSNKSVNKQKTRPNKKFYNKQVHRTTNKDMRPNQRR